MPTLAQMYNIISTKTDFQRSDAEIYNAINAAGFAVFTDILKESAGFFIKFDETSLTLTPPATPGLDQELTLPADCSQIVHMAERPQSSPTERWQTMLPDSLDQSLTDLGNFPFGSWPTWSVYGSHDSQFSYYGPYLTSAETQAGQTNDVQVQKIRVSPQIDQLRSVQLVYTAKWVAVLDSASEIMLPEEATHAILNWALSDILAASNDSRADGAYTVAERQNAKMLTWARARQVQQPMPTEPYLL